MTQGFVRSGMWIVGIMVLTGFSQPLADGSESVARSFSGEAPRGCSKCEDGENRHAFTSSGAFFDCQACNSCHSNWQTGWCGDYHCSCGTDEDENGALLTADEFARLTEVGEPPAVAALVARYPTRIQYNSDRGVLQLFSCDSKIMAQAPVSEAVADVLNE